MKLFSKKKQQTEEGTAVWINEVGSIQLRVFKIIGRKEGQVKIEFDNEEVYTIKESNIRMKRVLIYKTSDGKIRVQNPNKWKDINLKKYNIKELRFNLQNFALQEGKSAIHRWTVPPDRLTKLSPLFKLLMICIAVGVMGWAIVKYGTGLLSVVMNSRLLDCAQVLPKTPIPIGAIVENVTAPIGA
jgi:hypothetical protein